MRQFLEASTRHSITTPLLDSSKTHLSVNPNGAPPNFINPPTQAPTVLGTGIFLIIISILCVYTRVHTSLKQRRRLHLDDYCSIFGLIGGIGYWGIIYSCGSQVFTTINQVVYLPAGIVISGSRRLGKTQLGCTPFLPFRLLYQLQDIGIAIYWYTPRKGDVNNIQAALLRTEKTSSSAIVNAVCSTIVNIALFLIPMVVVPTLNMSRQKRRAIYGVFCFGALIIIADCVGIAYKTYGVLGEHGDPFWVGMIAIITVYAETFALVIISCIPALSTFYIGTFTKSRFYSTLQYGISYRLRRSEAFNVPSSGPEQPHSMHSTRSLVGSGKNVVNIEMPELKSKKPSQASSYSTLGNQESGQVDESS
ncbi:hypothetical protein BTUL_0074g00050 [Botrytis tulipae]|uniref:Rhodopsin domain-containing protein n=1 Tax=Botrytis tulipae TaxID=87230 RepID=A0A4Z1EPK7_9HELO|nr:hypothetical protein BTUL_0074g00050 [Botrytis tulipae]